MVPAELLLVQGFGEDALELAAEGVGHEFLDVHDGHVVFATEPMAGLADFGAAGVDDIEKGDLLLPNLNHRLIEGADVLRAFFESCSFGDVFHTAKLGKMVWGGKDGKLRENLGRVSTSFDKILYICNRKT